MLKRGLVVVILLGCLLFNFSFGCFTGSFPLSSKREGPTVTSINNFVTFAGGQAIGSYAGLSDVIDVYDVNVGKITNTLHLIAPRFQMVSAVHGSSLFLAGGFQVIPNGDFHFKSNLLEVFDLSTNTSRNISLNSEIHSAAVTVGSKVMFYSRGTSITLVDIYDVEHHELEFTLRRKYYAATAVGDNAYFISNYQMDVYSATNGTWTNIPFIEDIKETILTAMTIQDNIYIITTTSIISVNEETGDKATEVKLNFGYVGVHAVVGTTIYLTVGESASSIGTVYTYDVAMKQQISWNFTPYSFGSSVTLAASEDKLYITGWKTNNGQDPSTDVVIYDTENARHRVIHSPGFAIQTMYEYRDKLFLVDMFMDSQPFIKMYDLISGTWKEWNNSDPRQNLLVTAANDNVYFYGGFYRSNQRNPSPSLDVYNIVEDRWSYYQIPTLGRTAAALQNYVFFFSNISGSDMTDTVDIFESISGTWSSYKVSVPTVYNRYIVTQTKFFLFARNLAASFDVFDLPTRQWKTIYLQTPRDVYNVLRSRNYIFIAGGIDQNGRLLASVEIYDTETLQIVHVFVLSEARTQMQVISSYPLAVFISGFPGTVRLTPTVDIYNIETKMLNQTQLKQTERLNANFGASLANNKIYIRFNNYLAYIDLKTFFVSNPAPSFPLITGGYNHVIRNNIVFYSSESSNGLFFFFETTTNSHFSMISPHYNPTPNMRTTLVWRNKLIVYLQGLVIIEVPVFENRLTDQDLFYNQSTNLTVNTQGNGLRYKWTFESDYVLAENSSSFYWDPNKFSEGLYTVKVLDSCLSPMQQSANIRIIGPPLFDRLLHDQIVLCDSALPLTLSSRAYGTQVSYRWEINGRRIDAQGNELTLDPESLACEETHQVCVIASNPSGSNKDCAQIDVLDVSSIFTGPREKEEIYFKEYGQEIALEVIIKDDRCTNHSWYKDNEVVKGAMGITDDYSALFVIISKLNEAAKISVVAYCGQSTIRSLPYQIQMPAMPLYGVVLLVIGLVMLLAGLAFAGFFIRKRFRRSKKKEIELKTLLNEANKEMMNKQDSQIISTSSWEWSPDESFSYCSLDKFPVNIDTSNLGFNSKKADPVDVGIWTQGVIVISSQRKKNAFLGQSLLEPTIDIYAPTSPKFDIKVDPLSFSVRDGSVVTITVSVNLKMTTKTKVRLVVVEDHQKLYSSIDFSIVSKPSPWIDIDDVQMSDEILGQGG
eukprot:TRINITY_DN1409_c0_g1_i2.p1 TRINITY_DN1409_c0_g1~~TRINITY_DN1409_c0_g1_i2.p1  ORF type:complete len:1217 (-),score=222.62 TRINITY_DN1409_c0_g1_i2:823-4473(-)